MGSPFKITSDSAEKRACWREMRQRPDLTDVEFYQRFYHDSGIPEDIPLRLRLLYAEYLAIDKVFPEDRLDNFGTALAFQDFLPVVAKEFDVEFPAAEVEQLTNEGTFDAFVRCLATKTVAPQRELLLLPANSNIAMEGRRRRRRNTLIAFLIIGAIGAPIVWLLIYLADAIPGFSLVFKIIAVLVMLGTLAQSSKQKRS
jgi:hypothetical protein